MLMVNRIIVITGVTGGVGSETAKLFVSNGWSVIGLARNAEKLEKLAAIINSDQFHYFETNIKNYASVSRVFSQIGDMFGTVDVLVNNASVFKAKPFVNFSPEEIDDVIDTNLKGTMYCTVECLKIMKSGRIINIGSVSGTHGIENQAVYSASKYGMNGFAESLNQEIIKTGVTISTILPGGIDTPLWNCTNPYPGSTENLLKSHDISSMIDYIANLPRNIVLKNVTVFPSCEWH